MVCDAKISGAGQTIYDEGNAMAITVHPPDISDVSRGT